MIISEYFNIDGKMYVEASDYDRILYELKKSNEKVAKLEIKLSNANKTGDDYYNKCIDLTNQIEKLKSELETKVNFETDRLVKLPFDPLETANMLINAEYKAEAPFLNKQVDMNVYDIDDLEQIAEHLLVYCKHNNEGWWICANFAKWNLMNVI